MATLAAVPSVTGFNTQVARTIASRSLFLCGVTTLACCLLGYHPFAEDGGIYAAAAALRLDPSLFPAERAFAIGQTGRSFFVPSVVLTARVLHLHLSATLLLLHTVAVGAALAAAMLLARSLFVQRTARRWAVLMLAVSLGVPVAGTSLYLFDPYLTARSFSTPLLLTATAALLRRRTGWAAAWLAAAFALHPMMAAWMAVLFAFLWAQQSWRPVARTWTVAAGLIALMGTMQLLAPDESIAARAAALTRTYWFLARWKWYEVVGLVAPVVLLHLFARWQTMQTVQPAYRQIALATAASVTAVVGGSLMVIHQSSRSLLLARMQPLRILHPAYLLMFMLIGGWLGACRWRRLAWVPVTVAAIALVCLQRQTYTGDRYFELPGRPSTNPWVTAFRWAGAHTPAEAVFALDAEYTSLPGEDAQLFRAIALRSQLPDAAKDGGISSVVTGLAAEWMAGAAAQTGLNRASDADRVKRVGALGATWIMLPEGAATTFECPYENRTAKVCRLP